MGGRRTIVKNMAQMGIAFPGADFGAGHAEALIDFLNDVFGADRLCETGPADAAIEFVGGREERFVGDDVYVEAGVSFVPVGIAKRRFRPVFAGNVVLLLREDSAEIVV